MQVEIEMLIERAVDVIVASMFVLLLLLAVLSIFRVLTGD
jgi:hypothetical protein